MVCSQSTGQGTCTPHPSLGHLQGREQQPQAAPAEGNTGKAAPGKQSWGIPTINQNKPPLGDACCRARILPCCWGSGAALCTTTPFHKQPHPGPGGCCRRQICAQCMYPGLIFQQLPSRETLPAHKPLLISQEGPLCSLLSTGPVPLL